MQIVTHSATFDFWPAKRHALRVTPHGEKPLSVADYELKTGKAAKDWQVEMWKGLGVDVDTATKGSVVGSRGYND